MGQVVCTGTLAQCAMGAAPMPLTFINPMLNTTGIPVGCILDMAPFLNIPTFGVCKSLANPMTAALTAAAWGVFTPGPCIPVPAGIWIPVKPTVTGSTAPIITSDCMLMCGYGGCIKISVPGQFIANVV